MGVSSGSVPCGIGDRFVGDGGHARRQQLSRLLAVGREMKIGEQYLPAPQPLALGGQRLLHLHDHLGAFEDLLGSSRDLAPAAT